MSGTSYAHPLRSPIYREGPWLTGRFIAWHVTHPVLGRLGQLAPRDGVWRLGEEGATRLPCDVPHFVAMIGGWATTAIPCRFDAVPDDILHTSEVASLDEVPAETDAMEIADENGTLHLFDPRLVALGLLDHPARFGIVTDPQLTLVMFDRKDRPRFVVAGITQ